MQPLPGLPERTNQRAGSPLPAYGWAIRGCLWHVPLHVTSMSIYLRYPLDLALLAANAHHDLPARALADRGGPAGTAPDARDQAGPCCTSSTLGNAGCQSRSARHGLSRSLGGRTRYVGGQPDGSTLRFSSPQWTMRSPTCSPTAATRPGVGVSRLSAVNRNRWQRSRSVILSPLVMSRSGVRFPEAAAPLTWDTVSGESRAWLCVESTWCGSGVICVHGVVTMGELTTAVCRGSVIRHDVSVSI